MTRALMVFAKLPRAGDVKTRLGETLGMENAAAVYEEFARHAFALAAELEREGVTVYVFHAPGVDGRAFASWVGRPFQFVEQEGTSLGDRMRNAFHRTFVEGSKATVIIGTDVPELDRPTIDAAFSRLAVADIVIGPSTDGGYYLLAMKPPVKDIFTGIPWSSSRVFRETESRLHSLSLTYTLLPEFADIDTGEDYRAYLQRKNSS